MSQMTDFTLPSCVPGRTLHAFRCVPEGEVRAILQLSHGMVEFIDRYKPLAEYLAARGILVTGHDHLGHGGSIRTKADYGYFAQPDGNRAVLDDLHAVTALTKQLYPRKPLELPLKITNRKLKRILEEDCKKFINRQSSRKAVTQSYKACKMAASCVNMEHFL